MCNRTLMTLAVCALLGACAQKEKPAEAVKEKAPEYFKVDAATADAIMSGARTVDLHNYTLGPGAERFKNLRRRRGLAGGLHEIDLRAGRDFTTDDDDVGFRVAFAGDAAGFVLRQTGVEDGIGNRVAYLVGMAFADGLGGEDEFFAHETGGDETAVRLSY